MRSKRKKELFLFLFLFLCVCLLCTRSNSLSVTVCLSGHPQQPGLLWPGGRWPHAGRRPCRGRVSEQWYVPQLKTWLHTHTHTLLLDADVNSADGDGMSHMAQWRRRQLCWGTQDVHNDNERWAINACAAEWWQTSSQLFATEMCLQQYSDYEQIWTVLWSWFITSSHCRAKVSESTLDPVHTPRPQSMSCCCLWICAAIFVFVNKAAYY